MKRAATQKKSNSNLNAAGATPVAEATADEPTPATPITPVNPQQNLNRPGQGAGPNQAMPNGQASAPAPQQQAAPSMVQQPDPNQNQPFSMDGMVSSPPLPNFCTGLVTDTRPSRPTLAR